MKKYFYFFIFIFFIAQSLHADPVNAKAIQNEFEQICDSVGSAVVTLKVVYVLSQSLEPKETGKGKAQDFLFKFFKDHPGAEFKRNGFGSGFIVSPDGYILTNDHVVSEAEEINVRLPDGRNFEASFIGSDPRNDIAVLKVEGQDLPHIKWGDSDQVRPGHWVLALGNPFGNIVNQTKPTATFGIVSAIHRTISFREDGRMYGDLIQTDAAVNQGNSGGPLVNIHGEAVGISTLIFSSNGGNVGIGFAIPINRCKAIMEDLVQGREIQYGWLGIWLQEVDRNIVGHLGLAPETSGALVFRIEDDSPAQKAGLKSGDLIIGMNGFPVARPLDITRVISGLKPGEKAKTTLIRDGKPKTFSFKVGVRDLEKDSTRFRKAGRPEGYWRGIQVKELPKEWKSQTKYKGLNGVVVSKVKFGSTAHQANIRVGDLICKIDKSTIKSLKDYNKHIKDFDNEDVIVLTSRGFVVLENS